jgi:alkylhydroperoxidase family enzyme
VTRASPAEERSLRNIIGVITRIAAERKCTYRWSRHLRRCRGLVRRATTSAELEMMLGPRPKGRRALPSASLVVKHGKAPIPVIKEEINVWVEVVIRRG